MHLGFVRLQPRAAPEALLEVLAWRLSPRRDGLGNVDFGGWKCSERSTGAGIAEEAEASSPAQEAILEQALNARFQAEFN